MNARNAARFALLACLSIFLAAPSGVAAQGTQAAPTAGKITNIVPIVNLIHESRTTPASTSAAVYWGDMINTGHLARARVALDDGSLLNIGSDSNMTITQHDAASQQTQLELNYGRVRAQAVKLVKPNSKFEIHTPTGVAGVVGTDYYVSYEDHVTHVVVFKGKVKFCTLEGNCVYVNEGESSSIRGSESPSQPTPVPQLEAMQASQSTGAGNAAAGGAIAGTHAGIVAGTMVATAVGTAIGVRVGSTTPTCSTPPTGGIRRASTCGINNGGAPRINGQHP